MRALSLSDYEIGIATAGGETPAEKTTEREAAVRSSESLRALGPSWSRCFQGGHFIPGRHYNPSRCDGHRDGLRHASDRGTSESEVSRLSRGPRMHGHGPQCPQVRPQCRPGGPRTITHR